MFEGYVRPSLILSPRNIRYIHNTSIVCWTFVSYARARKRVGTDSMVLADINFLRFILHPWETKFERKVLYLFPIDAPWLTNGTTIDAWNLCAALMVTYRARKSRALIGNSFRYLNTMDRPLCDSRMTYYGKYFDLSKIEIISLSYPPMGIGYIDRSIFCSISNSNLHVRMRSYTRFACTI